MAVFWSALAAGFLVLAISAYRGRRRVLSLTDAPNVLLSHGGIHRGAGLALAEIMALEVAGFALAAAAAVYSALT